MFILDIYRHPEANVKVILHSPHGAAWITKSLHRILPIGHRLIVGLAINEYFFDIVIDQTNEISNYANHPVRVGEYSVELLIKKNRFSRSGDLYLLHLPRDLAPAEIQRNLV
jgi:hypothetical protein